MRWQPFDCRAAPGSSATAKGDAPSGPGQSAVGIYLAASPAADGTFVVAESVVLASPVSALKLRIPPISQAGSVFESMHAQANDVQVSAGTQPVAVPNAQVTADVNLTLTVPASRFEVRYRHRRDGTQPWVYRWACPRGSGAVDVGRSAGASGSDGCPWPFRAEPALPAPTAW